MTNHWSRDIFHIEPSRHTVRDKNGIYETVFYTHDKYAKRLYHAFYPLWWVLHQWDLFFDTRIPELSFGFATLGPLYSDTGSGGGNTTCDAYAEYVDFAGQSFSSITGQASATTVSNTATNLEVSIAAHGSTTDKFTILVRSFHTFNTNVGTGFHTTAATYSAAGGGQTKSNGLGSGNFSVVGSTQTTANVVVAGDFNKGGATKFGSVAYADFASTYNDVGFNTDGIAAINLLGITKLCNKLDWDADGAFGGSWVASAQTRIGYKSADQTGTSNDPKLVVTYFADLEMNALPTTYSISGGNATVLADRLLSSDPGAYAITGVSANLDRGFFINAVPGSYAITGASTTIDANSSRHSIKQLESWVRVRTHTVNEDRLTTPMFIDWANWAIAELIPRVYHDNRYLVSSSLGTGTSFDLSALKLRGASKVVDATNGLITPTSPIGFERVQSLSGLYSNSAFWTLHGETLRIFYGSNLTGGVVTLFYHKVPDYTTIPEDHFDMEDTYFVYVLDKVANDVEFWKRNNGV